MSIDASDFSELLAACVLQMLESGVSSRKGLLVMGSVVETDRFLEGIEKLGMEPPSLISSRGFGKTVLPDPSEQVGCRQTEKQENEDNLRYR